MNRCRRCGGKLGNHVFTNEFGDLCMLCFDDYFEFQGRIDQLRSELNEKIDVLNTLFIAEGRRKP